MPEPPPSRPPIGSLAIIAIVVAAGAGAFAYTAGWLSPTWLTPTKIVDFSRRPAVRPLVTAATMPKASASRASSNRMETAPNQKTQPRS
jgi:hypothetical protein